MEDRKKIEGHCSTGQSPQWTAVSVEEEYMLGLTELITLSCSWMDRNKNLLSYLKKKYVCHQGLALA